MAYWEVQRKDFSRPEHTPYVTIHHCDTGKPYTFSTQSKAYAFVQRYAKDKGLSAVQVREQMRVANNYAIPAWVVAGL